MVSPRLRAVLVSVTVVVLATPVFAEDPGGTVTRLLGDVQGRDVDTALSAAQALAQHAEQRAQIVPVLIQAIRTGAWPRCSGDMRDAIARTLGALGARDAVVPLLELAKSDKTIDHECVE
jgi:HEAT repeat protein